MDSSGQQISNPSTNCTPFAITCADHNHIYASKCRIVCPLCSLELERVVIPPGLMKKEDITTGAEFRGFKADLDKYITLPELEGTKLKAFPSVSTPVSHKDQHSTAKADSVQEADKCPRCSADGFQGQCYVCGYGTGIGNANHIKEQYQDCFESSPAQHNTSSCGTRPPFELPMHKHLAHLHTYQVLLFQNDVGEQGNMRVWGDMSLLQVQQLWWWPMSLLWLRHCSRILERTHVNDIQAGL
jgi:hypothetical protein